MKIKKADIYLKSGEDEIRIVSDITICKNDIKKILFYIAEKIEYYLSDELHDQILTLESIYFMEEEVIE